MEEKKISDDKFVICFHVFGVDLEFVKELIALRLGVS